jgi:hypothetical protein
VKGIQSSSSEGSVEVPEEEGALSVSVAMGRYRKVAKARREADSIRAVEPLRSINMEVDLANGERRAGSGERRTGSGERERRTGAANGSGERRTA